jgi:hypothetical protein
LNRFAQLKNGQFCLRRFARLMRWHHAFCGELAQFSLKHFVQLKSESLLQRFARLYRWHNAFFKRE